MNRDRPTPGCECATCERLRAHDKWRAGQDSKKLREIVKLLEDEHARTLPELIMHNGLRR